MHWKLHSDVPAFNAPDGPPSFISEHYYRVLCLNVTTLCFSIKKYINNFDVGNIVLYLTMIQDLGSIVVSKNINLPM